MNAILVQQVWQIGVMKAVGATLSKQAHAVGLDMLAVQLDEARTQLAAAIRGQETYAVLVEAGDQVSPGEITIVLATLDQLAVHTVDLTELDVAQVAVGQEATVSVDALPGREFTGVVTEIALRGHDYRGDVVYAVVVELSEASDAPLCWGMTALVEFKAR